ncbi:tyrosine-type recombinase/integrase [Candidatus Woesearchaeota archaeon]|nr:tyrosine-type recombinase/integrase [Candidatus Woesearchaeota archaeon]
MDIIYNMQREMLRRGYSSRTICTYIECIKQFMKFNKKDLKCTTKADLKAYIDMYIDKGCSGSTVNVNLSALKFLFENMLNKRLTLKICYSKTPKTLPVFLTKEEVIALFNAVNNEKHSLILEIIYAAGLRVSEITNLKVRDLEFDRCIGWVRRGKGDKDRPFIIAKILKPRLIDYIKNNNIDNGSYLFTGRNGKISVRTIQEVLKHAAKKAGIKKNIHPHSLRHSFATHLIENGYDVAAIQPLLGHNSSETTLRYIHMADPKMISIVSPYDELNLKKLNSSPMKSKDGN